MTVYAGAAVDLARLRPEVERICGPLTGYGRAREEVAGRALEAIILHDLCGWPHRLIGQRIGLSSSQASWLVRSHRASLAASALEIFLRIS